MNIQNSQKKAAWKTILLVILSAPAVLFAQTAEIPRLENGLPDMQGTWDFRTITPFQRPEALGNKSVLTAEEASIFEAEERERRDRDNFTDTTTTGDYNQFWYDRGEEILGDRRTSLVTSPANGRIPALTEVAQQRISERRAAARLAEGIEVRPLAERCIMGFNSGPPMIPSAYNNNLQIVQTDGYFMMHNEMIHNIRPVRLNDAVHMDVPRKWEGDSVGHWEGDTLVVDTKNFSDSPALSGADENLHVIERFQRIDDQTLRYSFTVEDETVWQEPRGGDYPWPASDNKVYEYACNEGNYSFGNIMRGARLLEQDKLAQEAAGGG